MTTIQQVQDSETARREQFEAVTIGAKSGDREITIAELRRVFEWYHSQNYGWKLPVSVTLDAAKSDVVCFCQAVEFFQGDRPKVDNVGGTMLRITSRGYQG